MKVYIEIDLLDDENKERGPLLLIEREALDALSRISGAGPIKS